MRVALQVLHRHGRSLPRQVLGVVNVQLLNAPTSSNFHSSSSAFFFNNDAHHLSARSGLPSINVNFKSTAAVSSNIDRSNEEDSFPPGSKVTPMTTKMKDVPAGKDKPWLYDMGLPTLMPEWKTMFNPNTLLMDISAGITVGFVAVPLSLAIAVASGVPPEVGLVTAAVSGVAGGLLGGTTLAVTGPAAAISLLVVGAIQEHGIEALPLITLACGGLQLASGVTRLGVMAKLVPVSVIAGFTCGVGAMILTGQVPKALGMVAPAGLNPIETFMFIGENVASINPSAAALALGTTAAMFYLPKLHPKMPAALLAVGGATVATNVMGLDVASIGKIPSGLEAFQWAVPVMPAMDAWPSLGATIFLIYAMTSAESLLSCAALEKMKKTNYQHNPDQELVGQGLANMGSALFMGMPVTSVIARSSLNVKLGSETRLPAIVQAGFVFGSVVYFSDSIATIPMPALSGMLILTGMNMLSPQEFKHCFAVQKLDTIPFVVTIGGMIAFGLAEGIGLGCASAWALNYDYGKLNVKEMELHHKDGGHLEFTELALDGTPASLSGTNKTTVGWQLRGPINFASMFEIDNLINRIVETKSEERVVVLELQGANSPIEFTAGKDLIERLQEVAEYNPSLTVSTRDKKTDEKVVILDMQETTSVEFTGVEEVANRLVEVMDQNPGTSIQMWNCHKELQNALQQCDPKQRITRFCSSTSDSSPYHFPPKEGKVEPDDVPFTFDSPHFRPTHDTVKN